MFDFISYFQKLVRRNRLAREKGFEPSACSGIGGLEGLLDGMRRARAFACVSDTCDEYITQRSGAYFRRRVFTVCLVERYDTRRAGAYQEALTDCRELFRQLHTAFIVDEGRLRSALYYLDVASIRAAELGAHFLDGCTGLYFMLGIDEPTDLQYNPEEWTDDETEE